MALGDYRIVRTLARGGMGEVVLAEDASGRAVAIKRIATEHAADPRFARMLADEARLAMRLEHPGIVKVLESGVSAGAAYLVMEHVDGADLHDLIDRGHGEGMPLPAVIALGRSLARALEHAHAARDADGTSLALVHRDVTPSNVSSRATAA